MVKIATYIGKKDTGKRNRAVAKEIAPTVKKMHVGESIGLSKKHTTTWRSGLTPKRGK